MKLRTAQILALLAAFFAAPLGAQETPDYEREPQGLEQDFLLRMWETADGLLPTSVRSIAQTRDGYVWLAAFDGLVRFDGARAVVLSGKNTPLLPIPLKTSRVFTDSRGRLWTATSEGRLFSFETAQWREHATAEGWPGLVVETIGENAAGRLIFCGVKTALEFADDHFSPLALPELPVNFKPPLKSVFDRDGRLWLASASHVWREEAGAWKTVVAAANFLTTIQGIAPAREGGVWLAGVREIRRYADDAPVVEHARPEGFRNDAVEMLEDFHGNLWVGGANSGLRIWMKDGRVLQASALAEGLPAQVTCLFEDRERNVLVGTAGAGVARFKPRPFAVWFGRLGGLSGTIVNAICEEAPGRVLIGTEGSGLRRISRDHPPEVLTVSGRLGLRHRITSLLRCRDGTVLAAVPSRGLFQIGAEGPVPLPDVLFEKEHVRVLFEDSRGRLWAGYEAGLALRGPEHFAPFPADGAGALTNVRGIAEDREGVVWLVGKEGLARLAGDKIEKVPIPELPPKVNLLSIHADAGGVLWIGVESRGILRREAGRAFLYTTAHGLPIASPGAFIEEGGWLWVSGEKGLVRIHRSSLDAVAAARRKRLELQLFNRADGLPSDAARRGYQPTACRTSEGVLWFATHKGAVAVHPQDILTAAYEPPAIIEEIRAELQLILVTPENRENISIPAGTRHMSIRCAVPSLGKPEYARFHYRLEGADNVWHEAGLERVIRFYDLQPGAYRFHVRAVGTDGRFVETPTSVALTVHPLYWQTFWFRALSTAALVASVALLVWRSQQARIRRQQEKLREQEKRAQLEAELQQSQKMEAIGRLAGGIAHDFNNLLTSVAGNAELLQMELPEKSAPRGIAADIAAAAERARELVSQILTFSRQRPVERRPLDLAPIVREALLLLRSGLPAMIEVSAEAPDALPPILGDAAQLLRIVMNLGTNAAHAIGSGKGRILLRAKECHDGLPASVPPGQYVRLSVEDNGRGMDDETLRRMFDPFFTTKDVGQGTGLGLSVVHGIVEAHEGFITVQSRPEAGTTFELFFPVTAAAAEPVAPSSLAPLPAGAGETVLVVDDEAVVLKVTRTMLTRLGYTVDGHTDPAAALAAFAAAPRRYRLLITDFAMPQFDGVELARRLWKVRPNLPAILYSGYGSRLTPEEARQMGFAALLPKPFQLQQLAEAVTHALTERAAP